MMVEIDALIQQQKDIDEKTRQMAEEIVDGRRLKTLEEAKQFAKNWIQTAAQHSRNAAYWETRARDAEELLRRCVDVEYGLLPLGRQAKEAMDEDNEWAAEIRDKIEILLSDARAALGEPL